MLDVTDRQIVIIGGGAVAARKATGLREAGAMRIRVIATEFKATFPPEIQRVHRPYDSQDLQDADLVFAATDSAKVNDAVVRDAHAIGIWVCRADASETASGDFITPAKFQSGSITVTVSAGSAALSAMVRDGLESRFDPAWSEMADAMKFLRPIIKAGEGDANHRARLFRALATPAALQILRERGLDGLKDWISQQ
jgi:precorrin-2 dehydrogenase/sirohydrochlorin ferrochelatase